MSGKRPLSGAIKVTELSGLTYRAPRLLQVSIDGDMVGTLSENAGLWIFAYAPEWLASPVRFALSPALPLQADTIVDGASERPVQWYFDNLLPEEMQRGLMAADANLDGADAFGLLEYYGQESAGSLTLLRPKATLEPGAVLALPDVELSQRIQQLPRTSLAAGAAKRMSLAGAQHKLAIIEREGEIYQPTGAEPSTHILKPDSSSQDYPHSVVNEWFVMTLARRLGLEVPDVQRRYVPEPVFIIERFDRDVTSSGVHRLHAVDACQLLNLAGVYKYREGSIETLVEIVGWCRSKVRTRMRLFDWLVFNALTGNNDAHLKNLSFLVDAAGIELAPHYDLLSTACYETRAYAGDGVRWPATSELAWPLLGVKHFSALSHAHLLDVGEALGLSRKAATSQLNAQLTRIEGEAAALLEEAVSENAEWVPRLGSGGPFEGEVYCLRTIIHGVIKDMVRQLWPA